MSDISFPHQELTREIIGASIAVHQELRPGLDEKLYERALCIEFAARGIQFVDFSQAPKRTHESFVVREDPPASTER
jgi:GxxExxY protein